MQSSPSNWPSALAAAAAAEAAVFAAISASGEPSFPFRAEPIGAGNALLSQNSFVAPAISRFPVPAPSHPTPSATCTASSSAPLPQRVDPSAALSPAAHGSLLAFGVTRCRFARALAPLFATLTSCYPPQRHRRPRSRAALLQVHTLARRQNPPARS